MATIRPTTGQSYLRLTLVKRKRETKDSEYIYVYRPKVIMDIDSFHLSAFRLFIDANYPPTNRKKLESS